MKKFLLVSTLALASITFVGCTTTPQVETTTQPETTKYVDGTYRGGYLDGSVEVEFELKDNKVEAVKYRKLKYKDTDFLAKEATATTTALKGQYESLINHLVGKDITTALTDLYAPENIATDVDGLASASIKEGEVVDAVSSATLRSGKIISAINDGLNRGAYKLAK